MSKENKYYTPEIEEFHVGFEYEFGGEGYWDTEEWDFDFKRKDLYTVLGEKKIRVKHLDREDIESLGWEAVPMEGNLWQHYEKEGDSINGLYHEVNNIQNGVWFTWWNPNNSQTHATRLFIKNKSELKKILKMIGI
jgi:hypothetical protein